MLSIQEFSVIIDELSTSLLQHIPYSAIIVMSEESDAFCDIIGQN